MEDNNYRKIAEQYFNKKLEKDEVVHHIDGNHDNNDPDNLVIMKRSQHSKLHGDLYSGLEEWQRGKGGVCKTCLFINLYENGFNEFKSWLYDLAESMLTNVKKNEESLHIMYQVSKEWKKQNNHDCYESKNIEIVK